MPVFFFIVLTCLMVTVVYFDCTRYRIPNWLNALVIGLYGVMALTAPEPVLWKAALIGAGIVFAAGYVVFVLKMMGGGDIKLLTVTALWVGAAKLSGYVMLVAILGGVLSLLLLVLRRMLPLMMGKWEERFPAALKRGAPVPYGIAIAAAFLFHLWSGWVVGAAPVLASGGV